MKQKSYRLATLLLSCGALICMMTQAARAELTLKPQKGLASWYGEELRGNLMANGKPFDPGKLTAASWFYPLGTRVRVTIRSPDFGQRSVLVTITDRGPAKRLVAQGRVIDLGLAAFQRIAQPDLGLVEVVVEPVR
jgi:rare lipoprotein A